MTMNVSLFLEKLTIKLCNKQKIIFLIISKKNFKFLQRVKDFKDKMKQIPKRPSFKENIYALIILSLTVIVVQEVEGVFVL